MKAGSGGGADKNRDLFRAKPLEETVQKVFYTLRM